MNRSIHFSSLIVNLVVSVAATVLLFTNCAKEMLPTGGAKDTAPPVMRKSNPRNYSTNISPSKIVINFNEFVDLKNAQQRVVISPPLDKPLKIYTKGKSVVVEIKDSLKPNTTYNINFFDVIRDFNEGNVLQNFQYVFSTGNTIDSLYVSGRVLDAKSGKPVENIQVGLYSTINDSVVVKQKPEYFTKTDKNGSYTINNICSGRYKIFALQDIDNNMRYNLPNENIAFITDTLTPSLVWHTVVDTVRVISQINTITDDTLWRDSLSIRQTIVSTTQDIYLRLFTPIFQKQFIKKTHRPRRCLVNVVFNRPTVKNVIVLSQDSVPFFKSLFSSSDSLLFYLPNKQMAELDSLYAIILYEDTDSLNVLRNFTDTLLFVPHSNQQMREDSVVVINSNLTNKTLELGQELSLYFSQPLELFNKDKISLFRYEDSLLIKMSCVFAVDSTNQSMSIQTNILADQKYLLTIDSSAFRDIYGNTNLSQKIEFSTPAETAYGVLVVIPLFELSQETIFQLTDKDGKNVIRQIRPAFSQNIVFRYLKPGTYNLRIFYDRNNNDQQDTGDYFQGIQPEYSIRYEKDITIRANWDSEITWKLQTK